MSKYVQSPCDEIFFKLLDRKEHGTTHTVNRLSQSQMQRLFLKKFARADHKPPLVLERGSAD